MPVRDLIDGTSVIELTPPSAVEVFHLGLASHLRISAAGVELESHHPGSRRELGLGEAALAQFMELFPHRTTLADFGPLSRPRLTTREIEEAGLGAA